MHLRLCSKTLTPVGDATNMRCIIRDVANSWYGLFHFQSQGENCVCVAFQVALVRCGELSAESGVAEVCLTKSPQSKIMTIYLTAS